MTRPTNSHPLRAGLRLAAAFGVLILAAGCYRQAPVAAGTGDAAADAIRVDGSSTVHPLTLEAARRYQRNAADAAFDIRFSGTTAGFGRLCRGEIDIADASRPINASEQAQCTRAGVQYQAVPIAMDAIAVVVHPANDWADSITLEELRNLWSPQAEGQATHWSDLRAGWPSRPVRLFGRGQASGTYDLFTERVTGGTRLSRKDYTASEDEELLASGIADDPDALGFFGIGAYHRHWDTLKVLAVDSGNGPVYPTLETVKAGQYLPLSRPLFVYVNRGSLAEKPHLRPFLDNYLEGLPRWLHFTGFMPLGPDQLSLELPE